MNICPICKKNFFFPKRPHQQYCSPNCYVESRKKEFKPKICPICNKEFIDKKHPNKICCSIQCQHETQKTSISKKCPICGKKFHRLLSIVKKYPNRIFYCSIKCRASTMIGKPGINKGKHIINTGTFEQGSKHRNWKGGRTKDGAGYILVYKPKHPMSNKHGYVREHRLIMGKILGRPLIKGEQVHHINEIVDDNRPQNLMYFPDVTSHQRYHRLLKKQNK